jgi:hypothetical protein
LIIRLIIQTIRRDPSRSVWTDEASNVSRLAEAVLADVTHGVVPYLQEELVQQLGSC